MILTAYEMDQRIARQQRERATKAAALTPAHAAAEGAMDSTGDDEDQAEEARRRVQHLAEPYPPNVPEVAQADLGKLYREAVNTPEGYPSFGHVSPEQFRRGPVAEGEAAYSVSYDVSARPVPVPSATLSASAIGRPLITDGRAMPSAGGC